MRGGDSRLGNASKSTYLDPSAKEIPQQDVKRTLSCSRLGQVISRVDRICGRNEHNESLPSCLRLQIPVHNLALIRSAAFVRSTLSHLKSVM